MEPNVRVLSSETVPNRGPKEAKLESMSGENPLDGVSESGPAYLPTQLDSGQGDKQGSPGRSDERIKLAVMTALHWDLAVPRDRVNVSVDRGQVTLMGQVARDYEKTRAEAVALTIPGVAGVTNSITFLAGD
jgi:osmotically-inducible protein OsmY